MSRIVVISVCSEWNGHAHTGRVRHQANAIPADWRDKIMNDNVVCGFALDQSPSNSFYSLERAKECAKMLQADLRENDQLADENVQIYGFSGGKATMLDSEGRFLR